MPEGPSVFITPDALAPVNKKGNPKLLVWILILVVILVAGFWIWKNSSTTPARSTSKVDTKARIVLVSDKKQYKVGDGVIVAVGVSTGGKKTDGTDVVLYYDNKLLQASSSGILTGGLYPDYPITTVDQTAGVIRVSGIASVDKTVAGQGVLATILMTAKAPGQAKVTVDYTPGSTTDSNIVESTSSKDVLESVTNLEVGIK